MDYSEELRKYYTIYQQDLLLEKELKHTKTFLWFYYYILYYYFTMSLL